MNAAEIISELNNIRAQALGAIESAQEPEIADLEIAHLGRKSPLGNIGRSLGGLEPEERREAGKLANEVRQAIQEAFSTKAQSLATSESGADSEGIDVTLPGRMPKLGRLHPLSQVSDEIIDTLVGLGFTMAEGPVVETDYYNFQSLNMPPDHSARSMHDTFYIDSGEAESLLLRTHTSPMQVRLMEAQGPPIYVVVPGVCARRDEVDANHVAVFSQIEGLAVDYGISFADLKGTLEVLAKAMFGPGLRVRTHPSYFPFTEPSAEVYVSCFSCDGSGCRTCRQEGWIEIMGAGMVHPNVLKGVGYDPEITGFAFGMGVERIAKLKYSVSDLRSFYENDLRFLESF